MNTYQACTFRCTDTMQNFLRGIVKERNIDRTSVLKLAVYLFAIYMQRSDVKKQNLFELVAGMESLAPRNFKRFASFCDR